MSSPTLHAPDPYAATPLPPSTDAPVPGEHARSGSTALPVPTRSSSAAGRRLSVALLLVATAVLYLWDLSASGYANSFYAAAVQAGSESWKAFFYGSLDAGNSITVDKPPASLWLMALSVRIFGLSSWSILVPQALLGVATVGVLYASVRRSCASGFAGLRVDGHVAGLVAGALLAVTPVATLMFRFDNPDALLVFLMTAATYVVLRATEKASGRWLALAGVLSGFAFLTKMLQAFLVLPAFVLVYALAAPTTFRKRVLHLLAALAAVVVSLGWWVAIVELVPASWRPYIGGSTNNSILDLVIGYNGLGRILGRSASTVLGTSAGNQGGMFGSPSATRLFDGVSGGMIGWLLPAALLLAVLGIVLRGRRPRTDAVRAALVVWTGWLVVTALTFSFMQGTYHDYYTVALAPAIAALVGIGGHVLWARRSGWTARIGLAATMAVTSAWAVVLLGRATGGYQTLRWPVLAVGLLATAGLLVSHRLPRVLASVVLGLAVVGAGTGPVAYALNTAATPHSGGIVTAGPVSGGGFGGFGGAGARNQGAGRFGDRERPGGFPGGGVPGGGQAPGGTGQPGATGQPGLNQRGGGGFGGEGGSVSVELRDLLTAGSGSYRWVAATTGSQGAASYQLATKLPVMAIGGFTGGDPSPTLPQFQSYVAAGQIHYYVSGGNRGGPGGGAGASSEIASWVASQFTATTVGGVQVYDLTTSR